jgi:hypothetical protein
VNGFPIRKSPDRSLFDGYPKLIAANHVLHRLLPPRHPPYALINLILLVAMKFSKNIINETPITEVSFNLNYSKSYCSFFESILSELNSAGST